VQVIGAEPGSTVTLTLVVLDEDTPSNNPVVGLSPTVAIRRTSDDAWYDFVAQEWDAVANYGSLGAEHKQALTDNGDGSYSYQWDQSAADGGVERTYLMVYEVPSGDYQGMSWDQYVFSEEYGQGATAQEVWEYTTRTLTAGVWSLPTSPFTGAAGLTYKELKSMLRAILPEMFGARRYRVTDQLIEQWINTAYQAILAELAWPRGTYEVSTQVDVYEYSLPTGVRDVLEVEYEDTDGNVTRLKEMRLDEYIDKRAQSSTSGEPEYWMRYGDALALYPAPDTANETVRLYAVLEPDNMSNDDDKPGFPAAQHQLIVDLAIAYACREFGDLRTAAQMEQKVLAQLRTDRNRAAEDRAGPNTINSEAI